MTTLVLLPGMDGTGTLFDPLVNALSGAASFKVVAYPPAAPNGYGALQNVAEAALPADESIILLGESFSGPIAISLAAKHPNRIKGVVLCCTFVRNPHPFLALFGFVAALAPIKQLPLTFACAALLGRRATPDLRRALGAALAMVSGAAFRARLKAVLSIDVSADLARVTAPILYLRASEDRLIPKQAGNLIKHLQPSTQVREIEGPHCLLQAAPVAAAQAIREFMRTVEPQPAMSGA
ncbi:alpha/beta fold hydrolase [Variovorax sp. NFACC27]|uniref:alpha/beta fold hydrolase n=1 Tax=unclassified Variovorax TaxID=663243 RepID=UPI000899BD07|nr:alpha/beta fold hydrolase [Variovorax sp. YR750]SEF35131.1 Pimeloyl-ACP methyl ester carboxylesterase [Variovorax sp. NFACC28]SEG98671.1 Pimeloyl-ACP methyl ester carboxylesterase [Variovorax sp. NFACC29]SFE12856.1 Pimeloyl-ACP methyl ester carboxylesterase [Variovorax sp. NFACC26]SFH18578.1 Pimeloyl-ACP methyl ester carboxylesterase [Variovorax sp. NFACC27]SEM41241.1 Pimeloyl-ACP methyl ester carboxylesterase [Variovorax sp. YR750]